MAKESEQQAAAPEGEAPQPELRLLDRRAFIGFPPLTVAPGLAITDFALQVPDLTFPFNLSGGPLRYQRRILGFGFLELTVAAELIARHVAALSSKLTELDELKVHFRPGYLEGQARLKSAERTPLTFKLAFDGDGERLVVYLYDVRLYGFSATPAAQVPVLLARAVRELELLPEVQLRGATGFTARVLPALCQLAAVSRGYKLPLLDQARLSAAEVSSQGLKLRFATSGLPPLARPDEELLLTLEGERAFAEAESLVALGKLAEAREAYLKLGDLHEAHPFAAERLLSLLVADPQAHELALDVTAALLRRRERSPTALWGEAVVRERRGEGARAAERYLALCALARKSAEEAAAFFAAEAAARAAREHAPQMAVRALHELLGLKPDHLPSLRALARASDQAQDRAGAIRAYRRLAALARDPAEAADAHVALARLCSETEDDVAGARLHCEAALRLAPDHPEALHRMGELCHRAGEHLRALKALDRLRDVAMARHELDRVGRANLLAGKVWETGLSQMENALLRYREACSLLPGAPEPLFLAARAAESLDKLQEALADYQQAVELAGPAPAAEDLRRAAHQSHHALARLYRTRLGDPARARAHLEAALALDPRDGAALEELIPYFRASGRAAELADACEKAAAIAAEPAQRAQYWAEAGELHRGRLGNLEKAERLLGMAIEADGRNRLALEGMLALAESRRDGGQLCRCLEALAALATDAKERARLHRRLAVAARDLAFDLELATRALAEVLKLEPDDLATLGELCGLHRKRADMNGLADVLELRARVAEAQNDRRLASAALRELAQVLELRLGRVGEALVAMEKAARLSPDQGVLSDLADLSLRCERPESARRALEELLSQLPLTTAPERVADLRARLGRACDMLGDRDAAREHYAAALPLRRLDDELAGRLEALYEQAGDTQRLGDLWALRAQALMAAGRQDAAAPLFHKSARALLERGEREAALLRFQAALEAAPGGPLAGDILETMAELELSRGARQEASRLLARRAGLLEEPRPAARLLLRAADLAAGTPREATLLAEAIAHDGSFAPALIRRAELTLDSNPRDALLDLEAALAVPASDPDAPAPGERLAFVRRAATAAARGGQAEAARRHLALYIAQRPQDLEAWRELADLHRHAGAREPLCDLLGDLWPRLSGPEQLSALREHADLSLELGRPRAAVEALRALRAREPGDAWAARALLSLLPAPGAGSATEEAERLDLLSVLISHAGGDERALLLARRAELLRAAGELARAREDLAAAAADASDPRPLLRRAAELAREAGDEKGELAAWLVVLERAPELAELAAGRLLALGQARLQAGDVAAARRSLAACSTLPLAPAERCEAWSGLAEAALAEGDRPAAAAALLEAAAQGPVPRRVEALLRRAELLEQDGELEPAADALERALALAPRDARVLTSFKRVLEELEDFEGLAEVLAAEAARTPKTQAAPMYLELARLYLDRLEFPGPAEAALRKVTQLDRAHVNARRELAQLLFERGELIEAAQLLEEAARILPAPDAAALLREGAGWSLEEGEGELALRLCRKAHALAPARGGDLLELARLLYLQGAVREALPLLEQIARQADFTDRPDRAEEVLLPLAELAEELGDAQLAERTLRRLMEERPLCEAAVERLSRLLAAREPRASIEVLWAYGRQLLAPSARATRLLLDLAERARLELADVELTAALLSRAAELAAEPLPVHTSLADLYRQFGRTRELSAQLERLAALHQRAGDVDAAAGALEEKARLEEESGRVDEALSALESLRVLYEEAGRSQPAAHVERRRAELLADAKLDLPLADAALERSFTLCAELDTARMGTALAARRDDARAQARWLERTIPLISDVRERVGALLDLAALLDGPLADPSRAEEVVRRALEAAPGSAGAEALLTRMLERDGRMSDLAGFYEGAAEREREPARRVELLKKAATIYRDRAGQPAQAAAALLAARASAPEDMALTAQAADLLHEAGRTEEAAEFDALLLEADPLRERIFERHVEYLRGAGDHHALALLLLRRAERREGPQAARGYLEAAGEFRRCGAEEQALLCESQAFERAPDDDEAFALLRERAEGDPRRLSAVLAQRAQALPAAEAVPLLRERAERLTAAGELLLAAEALDDLLAAAGDDLPALSARAELAAQAGGPLAARPYDQRLLAAGGEALDASLRMKSLLRLGHASLAGGALQDAADRFEAVVALDPAGERGKQALSLLAEVHSRTGDAQGLYRTSLRLVERADPGEAEALLRRAADLFEEPRDAIEALLPLARLRPADADIVDRTARGLHALGRHGDLLEVCERSAAASGGPRAAELLLRAAQVAELELRDEEKARELKERAGRADPENPVAVRALVEELRRREDPELRAALERLIALSANLEEAAALRLELARLALEAGEPGKARAALVAIVKQGPLVGETYRLALDQLEELLRAAKDDAGVARVLAAKAKLATGSARVDLLLGAAQAYRSAGDLERALELTRSAVELRPGLEGLRQVADLQEALGRPAEAAETLREAAELAGEDARVKLWLQAADRAEEAGERERAAELLQRVNAEGSGLFTPAALAERLIRLGQPAQALEVGFGPMMAAGELELALEMADLAQDAGKVQEALWAMVERGPTEVLLQVSRLAGMLRDAHDAEGLLRLARLCEPTAQPLAVSFFQELATGDFAPRIRVAALEGLARVGPTEDVLERVLRGLDDGADPALVEACLALCRALPEPERARALARASEALPSRRRALLEERLALARAQGDAAGAVELLSALVELESDPAACSALQLEMGELYLRELQDLARAEESLQLALGQDHGSVAAVRALIELYEQSGDAKGYVGMVDLLGRLAGPEAAAPLRPRLVDAYERAGQPMDAYHVLCELPETPELLEKRASLAAELGLVGELLQLRERTSNDPEELETLIHGYMAADLLPFADRLCRRLLPVQPLAESTRRLLAERLSPTSQGADLAVRLWPDLLRERPENADDWTLFAEALQVTGRKELAARMDGFGAALTASTEPAPRAVMKAVAREAWPADARPPRPQPCEKVTAQAMPRLHAALSTALEALGAPGMDVSLHISGGVEAYQVGPEELVLGAGALACFGEVELGYLCALALALGPRGHLLAGVAPVEELAGAAVGAFEAVPVSLAAARVLARLDDSVRGGDPLAVDIIQVLKGSAAFRAVALGALALV